MTSQLLNTLVFQYLQKVAPNLSKEFKERHKCYPSPLNLSLQKVVVYEHLRKVTPELAVKFHREHMADLNLQPPQCLSKLQRETTKNSSHVELIELSEEEVIDVTSDSESSFNDCDSGNCDFNANLSQSYENIEVITLSE